MGVVTVSASFGAGGAEIAPAVAQRLGLPFYDRAIPAEVAGRLGVPLEEAEANDETVAHGLWRLISSLGTMPDIGTTGVGSAPDERAYKVQTERVLAEIAAGPGGVVLGRAAAMVLRDRSDALHVRLDGAPERRLAAAVRHLDAAEDVVRKERDAADAARVAYVKHFYRCDPTHARHYHLVVDSTVLPHDVVVELVVQAARARGIGAV
ncbi:cytidylate kinase-like family protein [Modestobacter sp. NPDC049651]|uniref:cytidylate kinase-like family protein n=1 Tax=unclassified Modestobacter TaxID=2643866 RepID=UPI0033F5563E